MSRNVEEEYLDNLLKSITETKNVEKAEPNIVKEDIIKQVAALLEGIADKVQITNVSKIVEFDMPDRRTL